MSHSTSIYYVEVSENGVAKKVPHTKGTQYTDFVDRGQADDFKNTLVLNNPGNEFRLCRETTTYAEGPWEKFKK